MEKIVAWVDDEMQKIISDEFRNSEIILVRSLLDFSKNVDDDSLNIISASNFNDFDTSGFIYEVVEYIRSKQNQKFHVFLFCGKGDSGLSSGILAREQNVVGHLIYGKWVGTIQERIDFKH